MTRPDCVDPQLSGLLLFSSALYLETVLINKRMLDIPNVSEPLSSFCIVVKF